MKSGGFADVDKLIASLSDAAGRGDWESVQTLSNQILALDPANASAIGLKQVSTQLLGPSAVLEDAVEPLPDLFVQGRYEVRAFLGEGARKRVYLVHDTVLDRDVAFAQIKGEDLDEDAKKRLVQETQIMGKLGTHPQIVTEYDVGNHEGQQYVVMEHMSGGDLADAIREAPEKRLPPRRAAEIASAVCMGLEYAHSRGIIHQNLNPSNIWLNGEGSIKIGGVAPDFSLTRPGISDEKLILNTVLYLSPEQSTGAEVTARSDLYSLGVILYEMVTGRPPFLGDDDVAIISQHINTAPVSPSWHNSAVPKPLEALIMRLLTKNPAERPASASEVLTSLESMDLRASGEAGEQDGQSLDSLAGGAFVGRKQEMDRLKSAVEEVLSGRGRMLTLVGEPGIGKSRAAEELCTYGGLRGMQVLWGRCYEGQGAPPYWPWVQVLRSYVGECDRDALRNELGSGGGVVAELIPDVGEKLPDIPKPIALDDPESSRFRLFDAIATFLRNASKTRALLVVLDDLHWADVPSLVFLEFVAHELSGSRILLVGTYRDVELRRQHPLAKTLGDLTRERLFDRVLLRGLDRADVERFIELTAGIEAPRELVDAVHTHTEGNPLFITEVVRLLALQGELQSGDSSEERQWDLGIPEGVREVIGRRLDRLSPRCNEVLTVAAVVGKSFTAVLLDRLSEDISKDRLVEVLEEALFAKVIEELHDTVGHYQFTHSLVRQTLIEELTLTRRVRLHARIAEQLESLYGDEADKHAAELVTHFAQAETLLGRERIAHYSLLAGEEALSAFAYEEAIEHFERGVAAKEEAPMDAETARLESGLGRAMGVAIGLSEDAFSHSRHAFEYFEMNGDTGSAVNVAMDLWFGMANPAITRPLLERALKYVPADSVEAGFIMLKIGFRSPGDSEREEVFRRVLAISRQQEAPALEMRLMVYWSLWEFDRQNTSGVLERSYRAIELAQMVDDPILTLIAHYRASVALGEQGRYDEATTQAAAALIAGERTQHLLWFQNALIQAARLAMLKGQWQDAREHSDRSLRLPLSPGSPGASATTALFIRSYLEYQTGNLEAGNGLVVQYAEVARFLRILEGGRAHVRKGLPRQESMLACRIPIDARISGATALLDVAEAAGKLVLSVPACAYDLTRARIGLGLIAALRGEAEAAEEQYRALMPAPLNWVDGPGGEPRRLLGIIAHAAGRIDEAVRQFEESLRFCRKADYPTELAWTCFEYAGALVAGHAAADGKKALTLLEEGSAIAEELGMVPLRRLISALLHRIEDLLSARSRKQSYPDGLTQREVEVLKLVAKGFTNQDVANLLHISIKTVATHVTHILKKTGSANRAEASVYAMRNGLVGE